MPPTLDSWTHPSVLLLPGDDPVAAVVGAARAAVLRAVDAGWDPPPYDPFSLALALGIPMRPVTGGFDARTVPDDASPRGVRIEYDPGRPAGRLRFSVAHEIGHTLFPDVAEQTRNRTGKGAVETFDGPDDWQLEMLCNVAAAEFIMPAQTLTDLDLVGLDLRNVMVRQRRLQVSTEALLRRLAALTDQPATMYAARRAPSGRYVVDYTSPSRAGGPDLRAGTLLPERTILATCTAVGYTAEATETWRPEDGPLLVQAVGIPPYPGHRLPRVAGFVRQSAAPPPAHGAALAEITGSALDPADPGNAMIVHVVNDRARTWGGDFARRLARRHPWAAQAFSAWAVANEDNLVLGNIHIVKEAPDQPAVCSLVAQQGYGPSDQPRLRYPALDRCLDQAGEHAVARGLSVHAPRIGTGQAGGHWDLVRDMLDRRIVRRGADVVVYRLVGR